MIRLVADIGGTNSRLALAETGMVHDGTARRYANDDFTTFDEVADRYLSDVDAGPVGEIVLAVAGPVSPGRASLTNRGWEFDALALARRFGVRRVHLMNDLSALGQAATGLDDGGLRRIYGAAAPANAGQALVAGIGTGFNVCPVLLRDAGPVCGRAEFGHVTLPAHIADLLRDRVGPDANVITTVEDLFSGRGYAWLRQALERVSGDEAANEARDFYATLIGWMARDLRLAFLPDAGLYLAGSVARAVLDGPALAAFEAAYTTPSVVTFDRLPSVHIILDDMAALRGCVRVGLD